ncbi:hypothetical protein D3C87_1892550 [compost metagenome]
MRAVIDLPGAAGTIDPPGSSRHTALACAAKGLSQRVLSSRYIVARRVPESAAS